MFAAVEDGGRGVLIEVEGGRVEEVGEKKTLGVAVAGGGRRVVTGHYDPSRYEIRGGVAKTIRVNADPLCVAIVEGGGGMLLGSESEIILIR